MECAWAFIEVGGSILSLEVPLDEHFQYEQEMANLVPSIEGAL